MDSLRPSPNSRIRLQKFLAQCGVASRRAGETLIAAGRVCVNGQPVTRQGICVDPRNDEVSVDGKLCRPRQEIHLLMNKPAGVLCTCRDPQGRRTFLDLLPAQHERLYPVGRLDLDSEGLLIVTNDGRLAHALAHPRHQVAKTYQVGVKGRLTDEQIRRMCLGVYSDGQWLKASGIGHLACADGAEWYSVELREGRKRQIRRMFEAFGLKVLHLRRTAIGDLYLQGLGPGQWRPLTRSELNTLFRNAGFQRNNPASPA